MHTSLRAVLIIGVLGIGSCKSLPDIPRGTCGNHIIESNEDCDTFGDETQGTVCRAAGQPAACRFDCTKSPTGEQPRCPSGAACGRDAICRTASGEFAATEATLPSDADDLELSDFDGDGFADVRARSLTEIAIHYASGTGDFAQTFRIPAVDARPATGLVTDDQLPDLVVGVDGAISVWRSSKARTLVPTSFPSLAAGTAPLRLIAVEAYTAQPGAEVLLFTTVPDVGNVIVPVVGPTTEGLNPVLFELSQTPLMLAGDVAVGDFRDDPLAKCQEFALAFKNDSAVHVYTPCNKTDQLNFLHAPGHVELPKVALPAGYVIGELGVIGADLDADGKLDLVIDLIAKDLSSAVAIAYGVGDGTFHSKLPLPATSGDSQATLDATLFPTFPLAVGHLTSDKLVDYVDSSGIVLRVGTDANVSTFRVNAPTPWVSARIADMNGNGFADVIAGSAKNIDFYNGTGTPLVSRTSYSVEGAATNFGFGDFDGDFAMDVAFRQEGAGDLGDTLAILFGKRFGAPDAPISVGRLDRIQQLTVAVIGDNATDKAADGVLHTGDSLADIGVVGNAINDPSQQFISILLGSTDRLLQAPFSLARQQERSGAADAVSAVSFVTGQFTSDTHSDISALATEDADGPSPFGRPFEVRLWLAPVTGDARLDQTTVAFSADPPLARVTYSKGREPNIDWRGSLLAAVQLDSPETDATDEMVILAPPNTKVSVPGQLIVARIEKGAWKPMTTIPIGGVALSQNWKLKVADLNDDGAKEVIVLAQGPEGAQVMVFWNRKNGTLDPNATTLATETSDPITSFAAINTDGDPRRELLLVTETGGFIAQLGATDERFTIGPRVPGIVGGDAAAAGDMNGDGVEDIAIAGRGELRVLLGIPVLK